MSADSKPLLKPESNQAHPELENLRKQIDKIDTELVTLLEKRASVVFAVGDYKKVNQLPAHDPAREKKIKNRIQNLVSKDSPFSVNEMQSLFMTLVERFRFFESAHMLKSSAVTSRQATSIDFSKTQQVVLWGFGLLGSSIYLALNESLPHWNFQIVDPHVDVDTFLSWKSERKLKNIDLINSDQMQNGKLFILGGPVDVNARHLKEFTFPKDSLVFDLGSTKSTMTDTYSKRKKESSASFTFVGGHPLAGREYSGFENGDALLFYNKTFCWVTSHDHPLDETTKNTFDNIAHYLGAVPFWIDSAEHDSAIAWTSHLPQILSSTLARCLEDKKFSSKDEMFPGVIRDLLRVSGSSFTMWQSIIQTNQKPLQAALAELTQQLQKAQQDLQSSQGSEKIFKDSNKFYMKFKRGA